MSYFGRTGAKKRPRLRKFHAELLLSKFYNKERVIHKNELNRPDLYIKRIVKFSKGFLEFLNEDELEIGLTDLFFETIAEWNDQYSEIEELDHSDENLSNQGIIIDDDYISFDGKLSYSRFYKVITDEGESMNDPKAWSFNDKNIEKVDQLNFSEKNSPAFTSKLFLMKFYVLRKIDEVAFVTSRFVHCPQCNANYVIPSAKIEFQQTYKCERRIGEKICNTTLKKFPARKMIPTYIYEIAVEVKSGDSFEFKEYFLESFNDLDSGFYTGMVFGRTEAKTNSFYFTCLTAKEEKSKIPFEIKENPDHEHRFLDIIDSVQAHIKKIGFVIDEDKAKLPMMIETLKKLAQVYNKEINMDHSLYFGAPGIGKTYSLTLLHHMFFSNSGFISGPRFTMPGLTGGQKEIYYQDTAKKKNVPGLFSNQAFVFDEINNAQFLADDKATNLFKSVALAASGTSTTVGGKEFPRVSLIAGTANYDVNYLRHYENKVKKIYAREIKSEDKVVKDQKTFLDNLMDPAAIEESIPEHFDFYAPLKDYDIDTPKALKTAILRVRDEPKNYMTNFPKPLMERFYWTVLVHPKFDKLFSQKKKIDVKEHMKARKSAYSQRELISQLYVPDFNTVLFEFAEEVFKEFDKPEIEEKWSKQVENFLAALSKKHVAFFSMFDRIGQVHVFVLFALSLLNHETSLSFATKRIFERIISYLHVPIHLDDFHNPDFENYVYCGESKSDLLNTIKNNPDQDIRIFVDYENRKIVRQNLVKLENANKIKKLKEYHYEINDIPKFEKLEGENENRTD